MLSKNLDAFYINIKDILNDKYLSTLYFALMDRSAWGGALTTHVSAMEMIQKLFIKLIYRWEPRYNSDALYTDAIILGLRQLYFMNNCIPYHFMIKYNAKLPSHNYTTRHRSGYVVPMMTKIRTQRSFGYHAPKLYNSLPNELKNSIYKHLFKKNVKG